MYNGHLWTFYLCVTSINWPLYWGEGGGGGGGGAYSVHTRCQERLNIKREGLASTRCPGTRAYSRNKMVWYIKDSF